MAIKFALFLLSLWPSTTPYFLGDIDISGVAELRLLTLFLHCHGIYVFFLHVQPPNSTLLFLPLPRPTSLRPFSSFVVDLLTVRGSPPVFVRSSCCSSVALSRFLHRSSSSASSSSIPTKGEEDNQSLARIPAFAESARKSLLDVE